MKGKAIAVLCGLGFGLFVISATGFYLGRRLATPGGELSACVAGPGEICPSDDFKQELKALKALADRHRALSQDPKVKELSSVADQWYGMSQRMQQEINQTLQQNPGHAWDGGKEKFVVVPVPQPTPTPTVPVKK